MIAPSFGWLAQPLEWRRMLCRWSASPHDLPLRQEPLCLVSNSTATPPRGVTAEVVVRHVLPQPLWPRGNGRPVPVHRSARGHGQAAARKAGALGVISDCISPPWLVLPGRSRRMF